MTRTTYIADLHLGHEKVAELRGFSSVEEHDEAVMRPLLKLEPDDRVWILGDISSGKNAETEERALEMLRECVAEKNLVAGNHDSVSSIHRLGFSRQAHWMETFNSVQQFARIRMDKSDVMLSHYPYARSEDGPGRGEARYLEYRLQDQGLPLIHGHTHHTEPHMVLYTRTVQNPYTLGMRQFPVMDLQQFCVSWDAHRRLVTEHDIYEWIKVFKENRGR